MESDNPYQTPNVRPKHGRVVSGVSFLLCFVITILASLLYSRSRIPTGVSPFGSMLVEDLDSGKIWDVVDTQEAGLPGWLEYSVLQGQSVDDRSWAPSNILWGNLFLNAAWSVCLSVLVTARIARRRRLANGSDVGN